MIKLKLKKKLTDKDFSMKKWFLFHFVIDHFHNAFCTSPNTCTHMILMTKKNKVKKRCVLALPFPATSYRIHKHNS